MFAKKKPEKVVNNNGIKSFNDAMIMMMIRLPPKHWFILKSICFYSSSSPSTSPFSSFNWYWQIRQWVAIILGKFILSYTELAGSPNFEKANLFGGIKQIELLQNENFFLRWRMKSWLLFHGFFLSIQFHLRAVSCVKRTENEDNLNWGDIQI